LTALSVLRAKNNQLSGLPSRLADLLVGGLKVELSGNPLLEPLPELAARGAVELATYLRSLHDAEPQYEAKLLLVGEGNVGKTSLIAALRSAPFLEGRPTTHGIEVSPLIIPHPSLGADITVRAWDFGGQEVYRITHQFFFTRRAVYVVAWNARQGQEQDEVEGWLSRIRLRVGRGARVLLVATHCEERRPELDYPSLERMFPGILAGTLETDSRTGLGIARLRQAIGAEASRLPQMGQLISPRWVAAREEIAARGATEPQIWYSQFAWICEKHGLSKPETSTLAKLLHDLGLIIYYSDDEGLRDIVVLNPEWLTKAISYVLEDDETRQAGGILDHSRLKKIWHYGADGYEPNYHPYFLRLMEKFDICYRLEGEEMRSLVAQLVPLPRPSQPWLPGTAPPLGIRTIRLVCSLSEAAPGLMQWLTVRHYRDSTNVYWRRGVFLRHPIDAYASEALLELRSDNELTIEVRAPSPDLYFNVLRDSVERLIKGRWPGLSYDLFVPCPGNTTSGSPCPGRFRLEGLLQLREHGEVTVIPCLNCTQVHDITVLLTGFEIPRRSLSAELEQVHTQLESIRAGITGVWGQAAEIADTVRRVQKIVSTEVNDCPRLFTLAPSDLTVGKRLRFYQGHYQLTLWCEHPGHEHPWEPASYDLDPPREWLLRVAPYVSLVVRTLQLIVPLAAAVAIAALPAAQQGNAQARLQVMTTLIADLPAAQLDPSAGGLLKEDASARLTTAETDGLRGMRAIIFEHDPMRFFGGLRRVLTPSGDLLWVCKDHYSDYDPGLPVVL